MKAIAFITILFLSFPAPAFAAVYAYPSSYLPAVGDTVTASNGLSYEVTGECDIQPPGAGWVPVDLLFDYGVIPCHEFVAEDGGWLNFASGGSFDDDTATCIEDGEYGRLTCSGCDYEEAFSCPGQQVNAASASLDIGKAISFLLGGLTGLGFVMASSQRW